MFGWESVVGNVKAGGFLGEKELFSGESCKASCEVTGFNDAVLWALDKDIFDENIMVNKLLKDC